MGYPKVLRSLYVQVVIGITLGVALGFAAPEYGAAMKPLGDGFIKLIKMLIAPIIFTTVTGGIAQMGRMKDVGRIGVRAILYFEVVSTAALVIGLVVVNVARPGAGLHIDPATLDASSVSAYTATSQHLSPVGFLLAVIPDTIVDAFARGEILQVLLVSVLAGLAMLSLGERVRPLTVLIDAASQVLFRIVAMIMRLAPIGAFGAMAFTIGKYGLGTLLSLGQLMAAVYLTCLLFVFVVLGGLLRSCGFSIVAVLDYIKEEILVVLGTASSESVLPRIMAKLEDLGCAKTVVGLVVPTGYSFNLDGTSIYMTMAAVFVAQATGVDLSLRQELSILAILLLTSKGAAAVTGSGFITLAATLSAVPTIPVAGLALLLGVDRFMSEARAITNLIGNVVATIFISNWDQSLDHATARRKLSGNTAAAASSILPVLSRTREVKATAKDAESAESVFSLSD
ncbi:MAG TPA: dicarboxylate/amino acid:cation symporter [Vicinamibacterales bacterium]|nr:dicarboxylate/amino acid:cation symporter [Vicinamibacterales bacterium]